MTESVDVVVVGMGPAGEEVARSLAEEGLDVVGIESSLVGGECPYWGCVPSKMMIRDSNLLAESRRVEGMAGSSTVLPDWGVLPNEFEVKPLIIGTIKLRLSASKEKGALCALSRQTCRAQSCQGEWPKIRGPTGHRVGN
jgi:hypothetical protein